MENKNQERYTFPLVASPMKPNTLQLAWINILVWGLFVWITVSQFHWLPVYSQISVAVFGFSCICLLLSFVRPFIWKFQSLCLILVAIVWATCAVGFMMIGCLATVSEGDNTTIDSLRSSPILLLIGVWSAAAVVMGCVYAYFYMHQDKNVQWLEKLKSHDTSALSSFGAMFGVVVIVPSVLSLFSVGIQHIFWIAITAIFAVTFPMLVVDALYGAIWVRKHPYSFNNSSESDEYDLEAEDEEDASPSTFDAQNNPDAPLIS